MSKAASKSGGGSELDKDLQSLMELQEKLNMHAGLAQMLAQQQARAKTTQRRTTLMLEEMGQLEASVPTYKQVGKAYLLQPLAQVVDDMKGDLKACEEEASRLGAQQQHAAKAVAATEGELRELFKANPELGRQLAAASS